MKRLFILSNLFIALTCLGYADADNDSCNPNPCCPPPDPCAACAQLWPSRGPNWIVTPNAGPCVSCGADVFVTGEFIYWTAHEDHLGFALTSGNVQNGSSPSAPAGKIAHPDWKFRPGFKVGLGMLFDHDGWDIYANYTWIRFNNVKNHLNQTSTSKVLADALWFINGQLNGIAGTGAQVLNNTSFGKWQLHFNVVDLEMGRNFFVSRYLQLRPHFGLKGSWQTQKMDVAFSGTASMTDNSGTKTVFDFFDNSFNKNENWGIGIRAGLDSAWHFTKSFSFVGEVAVTELWEQFEITRFDFLQNLNTGLFTVDVDFKDNFHTIKPVLELYLGLRWESWYCCDAYHFSIEAGWEEQFWGDQNQFSQISVETREGDLSLQGLTVKARFDF